MFIIIIIDTSICFQVNIIVLDNRSLLCAPFVFFLPNLHRLQLACVYFVLPRFNTYI